MPPPESGHRGDGKTGVRRCCLIAVFVVFAVGMGAGGAMAHTELAGTSPANGDTLDEAPETVELRFSGERIEHADITITTPNETAIDREPTINSAANRVTVPLAPTTSTGTATPQDGGAAEGMYQVRWEILAEDGHTTSGSFFFMVGNDALNRSQILDVHATDSDTGSHEDDDGIPVGEAGLKGLLLVALIGLIGAPVTLAVVVAPVMNHADISSPGGVRRAHLIVKAASWLALAAVIVLGVVRAWSLPGGFPEVFWTFLGTSVGRLWLIQLIAAGLTVGFVRRACRFDAVRVWAGAAVIGGSILAVSIGWTSHSATLIGRLPGLLVGIGHIAGAAVWLGGLLVLAVVVPPYLKQIDGDRRRRVTASVIELFSVVALTGVVLVATTGLLLASWHLPDAFSLTQTTYGTLIAIKSILVLVALGFGAINRLLMLRRLQPPDEWRSLPGLTRLPPVRPDGGTTPLPQSTTDNPIAALVRSVRLEAVILIIVILLSGALTSIPTAIVATPTDSSPDAFHTTTGDIDITVNPVPATSADGDVVVPAGEPVVFDITITTNGNPPATVNDPTLTVTDVDTGEATDLTLEKIEPDTYSVVHTIPASGDWQLRLDTFVDGVYITDTFDLTADTTPNPAPSTTSDTTDTDTDADATPTNTTTGGPASTDGYGADRGWFAALLRAGAVITGLTGLLAVTLESTHVNFRRRIHTHTTPASLTIATQSPSLHHTLPHPRTLTQQTRRITQNTIRHAHVQATVTQLRQIAANSISLSKLQYRVQTVITAAISTLTSVVRGRQKRSSQSPRRRARPPDRAFLLATQLDTQRQTTQSTSHTATDPSDLALDLRIIHAARSLSGTIYRHAMNVAPSPAKLALYALFVAIALLTLLSITGRFTPIGSHLPF